MRCSSASWVCCARGTNKIDPKTNFRIVFQLLDIMRFRAGPQDLPSAWNVAILFGLAYFGQGYVADHLLEESGGAPRSMVAVVIQFLAVALLLQARRLGARYPQTLTALAGTGLVFGAISILIVMQAEPGGSNPGLALLWLGAFLWSLAVDAHVYRHALSITMSLGVLVAVLIFALNFILIEMLFPV